MRLMLPYLRVCTRLPCRTVYSPRWWMRASHNKSSPESQFSPLERENLDSDQPDKKSSDYDLHTLLDFDEKPDTNNIDFDKELETLFQITEPKTKSTVDDLLKTIEPPEKNQVNEKQFFNDLFASLDDSYTEKKNNYKRSFGINLDIEFEKTLNSKIKECLGPTIDTINAVDEKSTLVELLNGYVNQIDFKTAIVETPNTSKLDDYNTIFETINHHYTTHDQPLLNNLTIPVIINEILKVATNKFNDGQLALTIFNYLKTNLNLFIIGCNQDTYNEILKTIWIYIGKSSINQIDSVVTEMLNNGFSGNTITFNILNKILLDYYDLKEGKYKLFNTNLPIWNKYDEKRVKSLEDKRILISYNIRKQLS